jgi:hypothetical protein
LCSLVNGACAVVMVIPQTGSITWCADGIWVSNVMGLASSLLRASAGYVRS